MNQAYEKVEFLVSKNAMHRKRGKRLQDATVDSILEHAQEELTELAEAPDDIYELADLIAILMHYMVLKGWTPWVVENAILEKLNERFEV